jgi:ribosomal protein S18 acetylase RimI-like enzyme
MLSKRRRLAHACKPFGAAGEERASNAAVTNVRRMNPLPFHRPERPLLPGSPAATTVRRVRAGDAEAFQAFIGGLSASSRLMRFHGVVNTCSPALLRQLTQTDNVHHQAWLALEPGGGEERVVGEARFVVCDDGRSAEFAIAVADSRRGRGDADRLLRTLMGAASQAGIGLLFGDVLDGNTRMFGFLRRHGFEIDRQADVDYGVVRWQRRLPTAPPLGAVSRPERVFRGEPAQRESTAFGAAPAKRPFAHGGWQGGAQRRHGAAVGA